MSGNNRVYFRRAGDDGKRWMCLGCERSFDSVVNLKLHFWCSWSYLDHLPKSHHNKRPAHVDQHLPPVWNDGTHVCYTAADVAKHFHQLCHVYGDIRALLHLWAWWHTQCRALRTHVAAYLTPYECEVLATWWHNHCRRYWNDRSVQHFKPPASSITTAVPCVSSPARDVLTGDEVEKNLAAVLQPPG